MNVVDDSEESSSLDKSIRCKNIQTSREKYKKSILHRYLADSVEVVNTLKNENRDDNAKNVNKDEKHTERSSSNDSGINNPAHNPFRKRKSSNSYEDAKSKSLKAKKTEKLKHNTSKSPPSEGSISNLKTSNSSQIHTSERRHSQSARHQIPLQNER